MGLEIIVIENTIKADANNKLSGSQENPNYITVGIPFRPESHGDAHKYDCDAFQALNTLSLQLGFAIKVVSLPRDLTVPAKGETLLRKSERAAVQHDLEGIDLLYIPGSPSALETQKSTSSETFNSEDAREEENYNKPSAQLNEIKHRIDAIEKQMIDASENDGKQLKKQLKNESKALSTAQRLEQEYQSRDPYESKLIEIARERGMIILAVCAGSWRLLREYGGGVSTLPRLEREKHKHRNLKDTWSLQHSITIQEDTLLFGFLEQVKKKDKSLVSNEVNVNSTHWAVPEVDPLDSTRLAMKTKSSDTDKVEGLGSLKINAIAKTDSPGSNTPEGFETLFGAPVMGLQFHPETYLPGMPGERGADESTKLLSQEIFINAAKAAYAYKMKRSLVSTVKETREPQKSLKKLSRDDEETYSITKRHCYLDRDVARLYAETGERYYYGDPSRKIKVNMKLAEKHLRMSGGLGSAHAQYLFGDILEHGRACPCNIDEAVKFYRLAAEQRHSAALFSLLKLAFRYEDGIGVDQDIYQAADLLQAAYDFGYEGWKGHFKMFFERNSAWLQGYYLDAESDPKFLATLTPAEHAHRGWNYYYGSPDNGIEINMRLAAGHLRMAAKHGDANSQRLLGDLLEHGRGCTRNLEEAAGFYKQSAEQNNISAMFSLGRCYEQGRGIKQNLEEAAKLFRAVSGFGPENSKAYIERFFRGHPEFQSPVVHDAGKGAHTEDAKVAKPLLYSAGIQNNEADFVKALVPPIKSTDPAERASNGISSFMKK